MNKFLFGCGVLAIALIFLVDKHLSDLRIERCEGKPQGYAVMVYGRAYACAGGN